MTEEIPAPKATQPSDPSTTGSTPSLPPEEGLVEASAPTLAEPSQRTGPGQNLEPLSLLWRFLAAPQTLLVLLGLVALVLLLAMSIPQIPPAAREEPQVWLAAQSGISDPAKALLGGLGLFDLGRALWVRLLLMLMGLVLFVRCVESAALAWQATIRWRWAPASFAAWGKNALRLKVSSPLSPQATQSQVREFLEEHHYRWAEVTGLASPNLVAGRRLLTSWAEPAVYGALLVALIGIGILGGWGWQSGDWQPDSGELRVIGHGTPYTIRLDRFELVQDEQGQLLNYESTITWLRDGVELEQDVIRGRPPLVAGRPAALQGITTRQVGYVPSVHIAGEDSSGRALALQTEAGELSLSGEVDVRFSTPDARPLIFIPSHDLFLALDFEPACEAGQPALEVALVQAADSDDTGTQPLPMREPESQTTRLSSPESSAVLQRSGVVEAEDLTIQIDLDFRPLLRIDYRPGMGLVLGGMALAVLALAVGGLVSPRLLWIAAGPEQDEATLVQILTPPNTRGSRWPQAVADRLRETLAHDA